MTLIKSISGIRGTIGGPTGDTLNPLDIVKFTSAYAAFIRKTTAVKSNKIVVGRDARISGAMVRDVVCGTLTGMGFDVVDIGLASTPTTEVAVTMEGACGGIIITASHNPRMWNALKLLNEKGEFLNKEEGNEVLRLAEEEAFVYADVDHLGKCREDHTYDQKHIDLVKSLKLVDVEAIRKVGFRVAIDTVNSVGGIILPKLLEQLGVKQVTGLFTEPTGDFGHNPEPLEKNLGDIKALMQKGGYDVAFVVDYDFSANPASLYVSPESALGQVNEYRLLDKQLEADKTQYKLSLGKYLPSVVVGGGYLYNDFMDKSRTNWLGMVSVSVPLSDWWAGSHELKRRKMEVCNAENVKLEQSQLLIIRMRKAWNDMADACKQLAIAKESIEQSTENLRLHTDYYQTGTATISDLLDAQTLYQQSRDKYVEAYTNYEVKKREYLQATGR